jgi:hypothetical protein
VLALFLGDERALPDEFDFMLGPGVERKRVSLLRQTLTQYPRFRGHPVWECLRTACHRHFRGLNP